MVPAFWGRGECGCLYERSCSSPSTSAALDSSAGNACIMSERRLWTRDEIVLAIDLYCRTTFGRMHSRNSDVIALAGRIGRTPGSVALKLTNFASLDPTLDREGMKNASKLDREMWDRFFADTDAFFAMASQIIAPYEAPGGTHREAPGLREGGDYEVLTKARKNQDYFRDMVLASYNNRCCITGIRVPDLLVASHIVPWAQDTRFRTDPRNGLCLNALHDKAFDRGLITLDDDYRVMIAPRLKKHGYMTFNSHEGKQIALPDRFLPSREFLSAHREAHQALYG